MTTKFKVLAEEGISVNGVEHAVDETFDVGVPSDETNKLVDEGKIEEVGAKKGAQKKSKSDSEEETNDESAGKSADEKEEEKG